MTSELKADERELIRLVKFFKKKVKTLADENKVQEEHIQLIETCEKLVEQINLHAKMRDAVLKEREHLKSLVKENAHCPKCSKNANLKLIGTDKSPQGWKSNKYRCKRCNIEFVWNVPNNPWDMIPYAEYMIADLEQKLHFESSTEEEKELIAASVEQVKGNLNKLKPVVEASDLDMAELETRDKEMGEMINKFRKYLMIEKIKMED
jgi:hypothetical protein